jgi:5'-deoxynucleotidase YfbR-like HD superfamily hydrolase
MSKDENSSLSREEILSAEDEEILKIAEKLRVGYELKRTIRYDREREEGKHRESVAEHVFALLFLTQFFLPLEDPEGKLDKERIHELILFHDFGEIPNGDVPYHVKTEADEAQEKEDAKKVFQSLPASMNNMGLNRWNEYEELETPEARFARGIDIIEPTFELLDPVSQTSLIHNKFTYEMHIEKKIKATKSFPVMRKFVNVLGDKLKEDGAFWEEKD